MVEEKVRMDIYGDGRNNIFGVGRVWLNTRVLKTRCRVIGTGVRIPHSEPYFSLKELILMDLERQIKIKDKYCQLIINLGFDYDGFNTVDSLKGLIDELVSYARKAIECDDKEAVYVNGKGERDNILGEPID